MNITFSPQLVAIANSMVSFFGVAAFVGLLGMWSGLKTRREFKKAGTILMIMAGVVFVVSMIGLLRWIYVSNYEDPLFSMLLPSISGAVVGGLMALFGTVATIENSYCRDLERVKREVASLKKALVAEVNTWFESFERGIGLHLEECQNTDEPFHGLSPYKDCFFPVYSNNSDMLGRISRDSHRDVIVKFYTTAHTMISHLNKHNELLRRVMDCTSDHCSNPNKSLSEYMLVQGEGLKGHTQTLLVIYKELKKLHGLFNAMIRQKSWRGK